MAKNASYPVQLDIKYPGKQSRVKTFFRLILIIPIVIVFTALVDGYASTYPPIEADQDIYLTTGGIVAGLFFATLLMILFRQRYPRWWFDFNLELNRFSMRIGAYLLLLTDHYPSTEDKQSVTLDIAYPNARKDLNRWLPLVKWILAIPHYFVLTVLAFIALAVTILAWFSILFTARYPKELFDFVVGVNRWGYRVSAYAFLLTTDKYPPFSLSK